MTRGGQVFLGDQVLAFPALQWITSTPVVVAQALTRRANRPTNYQVRVVQIIGARRAAAARL